MKICYLTHTLNPKTGAGVFSNRLIDGVRGRIPGVSVSIMTSEDLLPPSRWRLLLNIRKIRESFAECDTIHALDGFPYGVIAALLKWGINKPLIITAIGSGAIQKLTHPIYGPILRWAYRCADRCTVPSAFIRDEILRHVPGLAIDVFHHGVDPDIWKSGAAELPSRVRRPYILSVGAIKRRKGYHVSIPAFAQIARRYPDLQYVIIGNPAQSPAYYAELQGLISSEQLQDRVRFVHGISRDELAALYLNAELFLLMPQNDGGDVEGFGLVFLEAAAGGLPVISSRGTAAEDAVSDRNNGVLVDGGDPSAVAAALSAILASSDVRARYSSESRAFARRMAWDNQIQRYLEMYKKL